MGPMLSLSSTFFRTPSGRFNDSAQGTPIKSPIRGSQVSLSDFLDRQLHRASVLPRTVQGKQKPFSSPLGCSNESGSILRHVGVKKREDKASNVIDVQVFKQIKLTREEKEDFVGSCGFDEIGIVLTVIRCPN